MEATGKRASSATSVLTEEVASNYDTLQKLGTYVADRLPVEDIKSQQGAKDASKGDIQESYLPKIIFRMVAGQDGHRCQCKEVCNPECDEKVLQLAMEKVRDQVQAGVEDAEREEIRARYYKKYAQTIKEEA